jgi:hypothetical protein
MLTQEQIQALRAPFPAEALKPDTSCGFELTSIKAAYVIERLNDVFGPCGIGLRYTHSPFEDVPTEGGRAEVVTEVSLQYRVDRGNDCAGCERVAWNDGWKFRGSNHHWSKPMFTCGGKRLLAGGAAYTDAPLLRPSFPRGLQEDVRLVGELPHGQRSAAEGVQQRRRLVRQPPRQRLSAAKTDT